MKIACFPNTYGRFGPDAAIDLLPEAGIEWLELPIKNAGVPSFFKETPVATDASTDAEIQALKERIAEAGLQVCSCNVTSGNPLEDAVTERTLKKLHIAAQFGVDRVVAGGGELGEQADWPQLVAQLRKICDVATSLGIMYCCETHPGTCQNAASMLELIERVDHPHLKVNFDTGNIFYYNESPDLMTEMERVAEHLAHVHLKDTNGKFRDWHFPALGQGGAVDFHSVRVFLESIRFSGPCSLELEGIEGESELTLEQTHQRVLDSLQFLREAGW